MQSGIVCVLLVVQSGIACVLLGYASTCSMIPSWGDLFVMFISLFQDNYTVCRLYSDNFASCCMSLFSFPFFLPFPFL